MEAVKDHSQFNSQMYGNTSTEKKYRKTATDAQPPQAPANTTEDKEDAVCSIPNPTCGYYDSHRSTRSIVQGQYIVQAEDTLDFVFIPKQRGTSYIAQRSPLHHMQSTSCRSTTSAKHESPVPSLCSVL